MRIMVIDDSDIQLKMFETIFNKLKFDCKYKLFNHPVKAIKEYRTFQPDIVFVDFMMPEINGDEVIERLMKAEDDTYFIMVTGKGYTEVINTLYDLEFFHFMQKPVKPKIIKELINKIRKRKEVRKRLKEQLETLELLKDAKANNIGVLKEFKESLIQIVRYIEYIKTFSSLDEVTKKLDNIVNIINRLDTILDSTIKLKEIC